jgi:Cu+-exporting ATPase
VAVQLLSGDGRRTTEAVAARAGIDEVRAGALPADKITHIEQLQGEGRMVAMVGDGVNDAPALARAQVGIAIGSGTEIAVESSAFTLLRDDLTLVREALHTSRRTVNTIRQNLVWAFLYNTIGMVLAMAGLLNPLIAAAAMLVSSLSVVGNSLRLREGAGGMGKKLVEFFLPWIEPAD